MLSLKAVAALVGVSLLVGAGSALGASRGLFHVGQGDMVQVGSSGILCDAYDLALSCERGGVTGKPGTLWTYLTPHIVAVFRVQPDMKSKLVFRQRY